MATYPPPPASCENGLNPSSPLDVHDESLHGLCENVGSWLSLKAEAAQALFAAAEQEYQCLLALLDESEREANSFALGEAAARTEAPPSIDIATPPRSATGSVATALCMGTTVAFPAIETVLAARARRLQHNSPRGVTPVGFSIDSPPRPRRSPPTPIPLAEASQLSSPTAFVTASQLLAPPSAPFASAAGHRAAAGWQLRAVLTRHAMHEWRAARQSMVGVIALLQSRGATAAPAIAAAAALRRLALAVQAGAAATALRETSTRAMLVGHCRRVRRGVHFARNQHELCVRALAHARRARLHRASRQLASHRDRLRQSALLTADAINATYQSRSRAALRRWWRWSMRRHAWLRRCTRRAEAAGGWALRHVVCVKAFDRRAVFVEEGATAMADAYCRRRTRATIFFHWLRLATSATGPRD